MLLQFLIVQEEKKDDVLGKNFISLLSSVQTPSNNPNSMTQES